MTVSRPDNRRRRYWVHDRARSEAQGIGTAYGTLNPRFTIIDRQTGLAVDQASTLYEARQTAAYLSAEHEANLRSS